MQDKNILEERWIVVIDTLCQGKQPFTWECVEEGKSYPVTHVTKREAQEEIADVILTKLQQFLVMEREWDEVDFCEECSVEQCTVDEQGIITSADGNVLYRPFENQDTYKR